MTYLGFRRDEPHRKRTLRNNGEQYLQKLEISDLLEICEDSKALAIPEIKLIMDFQEAIKARRGIGFLLDAKEDPKEESKGKEEKRDANDKKNLLEKGEIIISSLEELMMLVEELPDNTVLNINIEAVMEDA